MSFYSRPCCEWPIFFGNPLSEHGGYNYECACISSKYLIFLGIGHKYKPTSVLLKGSDSEKLRALNIRVISETTHRLPLTQVKERLPPIPELEVASTVHQQDQYT